LRILVRELLDNQDDIDLDGIVPMTLTVTFCWPWTRSSFPSSSSRSCLSTLRPAHTWAARPSSTTWTCCRTPSVLWTHSSTGCGWGSCATALATWLPWQRLPSPVVCLPDAVVARTPPSWALTSPCHWTLVRRTLSRPKDLSKHSREVRAEGCYRDCRSRFEKPGFL